MTIEELKVLITAQTTQLNREMDKVQKKMTALETKSKKTSNTIQKSFNGIKLAAITLALYKLGKVAVSTASDLAEVQNVVNTTFGNATDRVEEFARTAITQFGLSELAAKSAASSFMAMSNGMGVARDAGADMAITLAGLSGDLASFWNTSAEQAKTALGGIYTGETEALKKYGVVMTDATLNAYALSQGIKKQYSAMTQAEKVQLRYNYVLQATAEAQGDFAKTSDSWANQTKILKEQWKQLLAILGKGLIAALTPAIKALNQLLSTAINVANAVSEAFSRIFGLDKQTISVDTSEAQDNIQDATDGVDGTTDAVKDLKKELQLADFDEINQLQASPKSEDNSAGLDIPTNPLKTETTPADNSMLDGLEEKSGRLDAIMKEIADKIKEWKEKLPKLEINLDWDVLADNLTRLAIAFIDCFSDVLLAATTLGINILNAIDWNALVTQVTDLGVQILEAFRNIALKVIELFATIFSQMDINVVISNIIGSLSNVVSIIEDIATAVLDLGIAIAEDLDLGGLIEGITGLIEKFTALVETIVDVVSPIFLEFYETALSPIVQWIGEKLADAIQFVSELLEDWSAWFEENAPLISEFLESVGELIANVWKVLEPFLDIAWEAIKNEIKLISEIIQKALEWFMEHAQPVIDLISSVIGFIGDLIEKFFELIGGMDTFKGAWEALWDFVGGIISAAADLIGGLIDGIVGIIQKGIDKLREFLNLKDEGDSDYQGGGISGGARTGRFNAPAPASFNLTPIPALASGGALYGPTVAQMAEYPGAGSNPEIVAPQSIMRETMAEANASVVNAVMAMGSQVSKAIEDKETDIYMDTTRVTRKITAEQSIQGKQKGKSLVRT